MTVTVLRRMVIGLQRAHDNSTLSADVKAIIKFLLCLFLLLFFKFATIMVNKDVYIIIMDNLDLSFTYLLSGFCVIDPGTVLRQGPQT